MEYKRKLLLLAVFGITIIVTELFYRNSLFNFSLEFEEAIQKNRSEIATGIFIFFSTVIFFAAFHYNLILYLQYSLNVSMKALTYAIYCTYICFVFKLIYSNPRPFWINTNIKPLLCMGIAEYGNPSGHSMISCFFYLLSWKFFFSNKKLYGRVLLPVALITIFTVMFSRIYLGAHSFNQILYGFLIGLFLFFAEGLDNSFEEEEFINNFTNNYYIQIMKNITLFLIGLVCYFVKSLFIDDKTYKKYIDVISKECPNVNLNKALDEDMLYGIFIMFLLIGANLGVYFLSLQKNIDFKAEGIHFNNIAKIKKKIYFVILVVFVLVLPFVLLVLILKVDNKPLSLLLNYLLPYTLTGFSMYGLIPILSIKYFKNHDMLEFDPAINNSIV